MLRIQPGAHLRTVQRVMVKARGNYEHRKARRVKIIFHALPVTCLSVVWEQKR
jgi:hypothetical protein